MKTFYILFICFYAMNCTGQNISGVWRGSFGHNFFGDIVPEDSYKFEVQIDHRQEDARGVTYSYHNTDFYAKASLTGKWNKQKKSFTLIEGDIIEVRKMSGVSVCSMTCYLTYSKVGDVEYLIGTYQSFNDDDKSFCGGGKVRLKKTVKSVFKKEPFLVRREAELEKLKKANLAKNKNPSLNKTPTKSTENKPKTNNTTAIVKPKENGVTLPKINPKVVLPKSTPKVIDPVKPKDIAVEPKKTTPPPIVRERKNEIVETIPLDNENITVNLYDNGEIDGDVISVYLNGKILVSKQTLNYDPITISLKKSELLDLNELVMVAENMGTIPPNTASMIVYVGSKRYEVRMESNTSKNAAVRFEK
jgi:hypothetical protein